MEGILRGAGQEAEAEHTKGRWFECRLVQIVWLRGPIPLKPPHPMPL